MIEHERRAVNLMDNGMLELDDVRDSLRDDFPVLVPRQSQELREHPFTDVQHQDGVHFVGGVLSRDVDSTTVGAELVHKPYCLTEVPPIRVGELVCPLVVEVFEPIADVPWKLRMHHVPAVELVERPRNRLAQPPAVKLRRLPVTSEEPLLHFDVVVNDRVCEARIDNLR